MQSIYPPDCVHLEAVKSSVIYGAKTLYNCVVQYLYTRCWCENTIFYPLISLGTLYVMVEVYLVNLCGIKMGSPDIFNGLLECIQGKESCPTVLNKCGYIPLVTRIYIQDTSEFYDTMYEKHLGVKWESLSCEDKTTIYSLYGKFVESCVEGANLTYISSGYSWDSRYGYINYNHPYILAANGKIQVSPEMFDFCTPICDGHRQNNMGWSKQQLIQALSVTVENIRCDMDIDYYRKLYRETYPYGRIVQTNETLDRIILNTSTVWLMDAYSNIKPFMQISPYCYIPYSRCVLREDICSLDILYKTALENRSLASKGAFVYIIQVLGRRDLIVANAMAMRYCDLCELAYKALYGITTKTPEIESTMDNSMW